MLKNKIIGRKIRNIVILLMAMIIMIGAYRYIDKSKAEKVIEIGAIALDNYGYLADEEFTLEAKQLEDGSYEIELPENVNSKKINRIVKIGLGEFESTTTENAEIILEDGLEIIENRIYLTKEQVESEKVNIEVAYDVAILETNEEGIYNKILLSEKSAEERNQIQITEATKTLYSKTLKYEDERNGKIVELKGYLPKDAQIQVEEVSQEQLTEIFGEKKIDVAYDIKIILKVVTQIPADEANPDSKPEEIVETIEINPEDYGEYCEVSIKDANIVENSQVYHVKEDNTYEEVTVKDSTDGNVSFEAQTFSVYAVAAISEDEISTTADSTLPSTSYSTPYLPDGYSQVSGTNLSTGLVIQDSKGNQFVWIEVPRSTSVYSSSTLKYDLDSLTGTALTNAYSTIESKLQTYAATYRRDGYSDTYSSKLSMTSSEYTELKQKMLKSVFENGGFYIGRYEAGTTRATDLNKTPSGTPVIKQHAYPYWNVTADQSQTLSEKFSQDGYIGSLPFGIQRSLVLRYLQSKGSTVSELNENSSAWGNYTSNVYTITNKSVKYRWRGMYLNEDGTEWLNYDWTDWLSAPFDHPAEQWVTTGLSHDGAAFLTTGASDEFAKQNIYDLAGNVGEFTLERNESTNYLQCMGGSGASAGEGNNNYGANRRIEASDGNNWNYGFRVCLFKDETDVTAPTVEITASETSPTNASSITYTFTFSESVNNFTKDSITVTNGTKSTFTKVSDSQYTLVVTNSGSYTQTVKVAAGKCTDNAGNSNTESNTVSIEIDRTAPTVTITASKTSPTKASSITYTFTFSEPVKGFTSSDITVTNGTKSTFTKVSDSQYTLVVTNSGSYTQTVKVAASKCTDIAGNNNEVSNTLEIEIDRTNPQATITADKTSPTNASSITYTFTFNEPVKGFTASDITVTNGTKGTFTGSDGDDTYTLVVTNSGSCTQQVGFPAAACEDLSGNSCIKSNPNPFEMVIDRTVPVWADSISDGTYSSSAGTYTLNLIGSDETSLNTSSSALSTSKMTVTINGSSATYSLGTTTVSQNTKKFPVTIKNIPTDVETVTIKITINAGTLVDTAGNTSAKKEYEFTIDSKRPTVEITANPSTSPTNASSITYTFKFNEAVTGFSSSGVTVTNGTRSTFTKVSDSEYTLVVTNSGNCTQTVKVAEGACTDLSGNTNTASNTVTMVIDRTVPVWNDNISNGTYSSSAKTYTLNLIGSDESALNDSESTLTGKITVTVDGSNATYTLGTATLNDKTKTFPLTITNFTGGTVSISISAGALKDTAGNTSAAKTYSFSIDGTAPVWAEDVSDKSYNSSTKAFSVNLVGSDETGLNNSSSTLTNKITVTVNGSTVSSSNLTIGTTTLSNDGKTKTFPLTIKNFAGGTVKIKISSGALVDTSGNSSEAKEYEFDVDITAPVWGTATGTYNPDDQSYTITVTGSDETKLNNTSSNLTTSNTTLTVGGTKVTPTITTTSTSSTSETYQIKWSNHTGGAISLTINAGALVDDFANTSAQKTYTFDAVDVTKPTWNDSISGGTYDEDTGEYTLSFIGSDNEALNDAESVLSSSNVTITAGGTTVNSNNLVFGTPTLSDDGKTKTFPLTIKNFTGGSVSITINSGALKDATGNKSDSKTYTFVKDITRPVWNDSIGSGLYDSDTKAYTFNIIGTDETALSSSSTLSSYMTMKIDGSTATNYSIGTVTTSSDNKTKSFPVTITNYTGGEIVVSISEGALKDTSNNTSFEKEYKFTPDITAPVWTYQNVVYDADGKIYSVELVGTDETELNTTQSTLIASGSSKNLTVTSGETSITPTLTKLSTSSTQVIYKLVIENYPGGEVTININKGALIDTSSNQSKATEIKLSAKDIQKPTWVVQNAQYSIADGTYTFELVVTDNEELDSSVSLVTSGDNKNITVKCGDTTVTPTITRTISTNKIVYTVTITDYPSGIVYVSLSEGAAKDVTGNKSEAVDFELPAEDIAKPVWKEEVTVDYNYTTKNLVIELVGTDETSLNDTKSVLTLLSNILVNVGGTTLDSSRVGIVNGAISSDKMTKNYTITISNYEGGVVEISLSAGALEDLSGKLSDTKTFTIDDVIRPLWSMEGDGDYNKADGSYTLTLKANDETSLATASLTTSNSSLTVNGSEVTYEITDITPESETEKSRTYSVKIPNFTGGTISLGIDAGTLVDSAGNQNISATFSVTPDIVSPTWTAQNAGYTYLSGNEVSVELVGTDDVQLLLSTLNLSDITVLEGDTEIDSENLSLSAATSLEDGKNGVKYTLTITGYSGGSLSIVIPEGTLEDPSGNVNNETTLSLGVIPPLDDDTPPEVDNISSTIDKGAEAIYIEFDVTDEWFDFSEAVESGEFTVIKTVRPYWGSATTTDITSGTTIQVIEETEIANGKHYKIKVSNLDTSATSGTVTIKVSLNANAVYDLADNGNVETELYNGTPSFTLSSSDAAFIKKSVELNEEEEKLIITVVANTKNSFFDAFKSYIGIGSSSYNYSETDFQSDILDLTIDGESVLNLSNPTMAIEKISSTSSGIWWTNTTTIQFKITLSNFEESSWQDGKSFTEWSGNVVLTLGDSTSSAVIIEESILLDKNTEDSLFADFINPEIKVTGSSTTEDMDSVTLSLLATDKYYTPGQSIDPNKVNLLIDGVTATQAAHGITITYATPTVLEGTRNGATEQYGIEQNITITGLAAHLGKGLKLRLGEGAIIDLSGNPNIQKDVSLFNTLMVAKDASGNYETSATSGFLGNSSIQRQNIESVQFLSSTSTAPDSGTWDVSAAQDGSIIAWATGSGPYQVYIASDGPIYANQDSSYLFSYIGYSSSCTDETVIKNLDLLSTRFATNMDGMFQYCGYTKMTGLTLGSSFNVSNVTSMNSMFAGCGYMKMTSLNLGENFNTTKVQNMASMFQNCGNQALTSLDLGDQFYTSNVTTMENMFNGCGQTAMTTLDLGPAFTKIADSHDGFATNCGKDGAITIYTGEAIYSNANEFKTSTADDATKISYTRGTINPKYKPQWSKVTTTLSTDYKTLTIKLQGTVDSTDYGSAIKTVTNKLSNGIVEANTSTPINLKVDGEVANNIQKQISMVYTGPAETVTAEIVLSNFEEAVIQSGKSYKEWAGNVALQLATGTLVDSYGNRNLPEVEIKDETEIDTNTDGKMFADFIKPTVKYEHTDTTINQTTKTATIVFCLLDKYYASENLSLDNTEIQMDGTDLRQTPVEIGWAEEDITEDGNVIGRKYTVTLTELQQNVIASGKSYLDFSGVVSIIVPAAVTDKSGNVNNATTITVGIDEPENPDHDGEPEGETDHTSGTVIDFVNPIWTNVENGITLDFENSIATVKVKATDKYFAPEKCTLTSDNIKFYLDGVLTTTGVTIQITSTTPLTEQRTVNGVQTEVQYGAEYTITITGITLDSDQAKIVIPAGTIEDQYGNKSDENTIILYNRLRSAETETDSTSGFLGNTAIQRQDIQNVTFVSGIAGSTDADTKQVWDVSAAQDGTILAWTKQESAPYTVYIGSEGAILANRNSSYLFAHIGFGTTSSVTQTISNLNLLDTSSVTNMQGMFWFCGYKSMTSLDLGDNFHTSNVTNMKEMFTGCGYTAMTSFDLGDNFDTTNVTDMSWMFANCGYTKMTELNLGANFNTSKVTDMNYMFMDCGNMSMTTLTLGNNFNTSSVQKMNSMFKDCGYEKMTSLNLGTSFITTNVTDMSSMFEQVGYKALTSLDLGSNFNTSKVTDMSRMFYGAGATAMTSLTLGNNFDTSAVTDMNSMFMYCGQSSMTSLSLGAKFYTTNVTDMTDMFNACGQSNMTSLDLGPAFTKIASTNDGFATDCGQMENVVIYVGESIYSNEHAFRLSTDSTTEISFTRGTINPKYKPEWTVSSTTYDATAKTLTVTLQGQVNSTDYTNAIKTVTNKFTNGTTTLVNVNVDSEETTNITKTISGASSTAATTVTCTLTLSNFEEDSWQSGKSFKEWSGNVELQMLAGSLVDNYGNRNLVHTEEDETKSTANTNGKLFADFIKPEIRYEYSETEINYTTNTVTVYFSITDKYFKGLNSAKVASLEAFANLITVEVDEDAAANSVITKTVEEVKDVEHVVNSMNKTVGKQYKIVIEGLDSGDGFSYSGPMSLTFPAELAEDYSGNKSDGKTITIGIDDPSNSEHPDHDTEVVVDVVDPIWKVENVTTTTADLIATDKYFSEVPYTVDELKALIQVKVGETVKTDGITLTGPTAVTNGQKYTLTIPNYEGEGETESYEDFLEERELYETSNGAEGRLYREQFAGDIVVIIPAGTIKDTSGNTNKEKEFNMGKTGDTLSPETVFVSSTKNTTNKTETIIFDVTDKNYKTCTLDKDDISVFIDNVETTTVNKEITNVETLTATIDGTTKTIGKRYTLVLSSFEVAGLENGYDYKGLSGTVSIEIAEGVAEDQSGNTSGGRKADGTNTSAGQPMIGDLVDFIKPSIVYRSSQTVKNTDEVQIVFDVTDKYFSSNNLTVDDITIMIQDGTDDSDYINMKDITGVNITLGAVDKYEDGPFNKTVGGVIKEGLTNQVIGQTYTVTISNLEQAEIADGRKYLDYSGNVTITLADGKVSDTSNNTNNNSSLTMGIEEPEGTGTKDVLDIVRPVWTLLSQDVDLDAQESVIKLRSSDKYFLSSSLTNDSIELWIDGEKVETNGTTGRNITIISTTPIYETWTMNGVESQVQVGVEYEIKATGFEVDKQQAKIKIPQGTITDQAGNVSLEYEFILYSCLMAATQETTPGTTTSAFLKNPYGVQRQNIENITFVSGLLDADKTKWWDVSAVQDESIMAWYEDADGNGAYEVYIGSDGAIYANPDSSYLFSNIGTANICGKTEVIKDLDLLNTKRVTNMNYMFTNCGTKAMTSLDLGDNFETSNVTSMVGMFSGCGQNVMTTLDLGTKFDTSSVTDMSNMFNGCGQNAMTTLKVGDTTNIADFDTALVQNMSGMFQNFGHKLVSLTLGENFDTSEVTNMSNMFNGTGKTSMTTLTLGDNFNTEKVQNMSGMFQDFATSSTTMTTLDLGDNFYTTLVTDMTNMFNGCGTTAMTTLDLGPAFTNIATTNSGFVTNCGKSGQAVILAGEAIYSNMKAFRLSSSNNTEISYANGTINPIYKPEWQKVSTNISAQTISITVKGTVDTDIYTSTVDGNLTSSSLVTVYINGTEVTSITKTVSSKQVVGNEVQYTITLSNFEEAVRQSGKNFKEWSGNISLQFATGTLIDGYGHQNLSEIDIDTSGTMQDIKVEDESEWSANQDGNMFADFIKPEFTYVYSEDDINTASNKLTVVFDITDRYFNNTEITNYINLITVKSIDEDLVVSSVRKTLTKKTSDTEVTNGNIKYDTEGNIYWNDIKVGERYELVLTNFQKDPNDGFYYSGPMSITFPSEIATDNSNNKNDAKTITIGINEPDGTGSAEIVDLVKPVWLININEEEEDDVTIGADSITIKMRAIDKYFSSVTIDEDDITVKVNGNISTGIVKDITSTAPTNVYDTVAGVENTLIGKEYTLILSNIIPVGGGYETFVPTNLNELDAVTRDTYEYKYAAENGGNISIEIAGQTIVDTSGNESETTSYDIGNIDLIKPEVYVVRKTQDAAANTETIVFNVTDRNYDSSNQVTKDELTLWIDDVQLDSLLTNATLSSVAIKAEIDEEEVIVGHQYTLVIPNIAETSYQTGKSYLEYSGTLKIQIKENASRDQNGNRLNTDTTTITDFVDYLKPQIAQVAVTNPKNTTDKTYTMSFSVIDKYLDTTNMVTGDEILVYIDGELDGDTNGNGILDAGETPTIVKTLSSTAITATMNKTVDGVVTNGTYTIGYTYTLVLSDFEQTTKQTGKNFMEWSGTVKIEIVQGAVNDKNGTTNTAINTLDADVTKRTINGEHVDFIKPVVEKVSSEIGTNTETIYFNVIDKYLDTTDLVTDTEIKVYVDGEEVTNLTKTLTRVSANDVTATVNSESRTVSQQYKLVLSGFEQSARNARNYKDWSGTVSIELVETAVKDTSENNLAPEQAKRTITGDFADFIKPDLKYVHQSTDISTGTKTYTMTFDITDKYYSSGELALADLTIKMQNGQLDSNGDEIVHDLKELATQGKINIIGFSATPYYAGDEDETIKVTNATTGVVEEIAANTHQIGHTYTLTITGLDQLMVETGNTTANYSGVITVAVGSDKIKDRGPSGDGTNPNGNVAKTITSGVDIPGGTGTGTPVDVVSPVFEKVSSTAYAFDPTDTTKSKATIKFKGTDTYFVAGSTLSVDDIQVVVNGNVVTSGITKTITATEELEEDRIVNGTTQNDVQYGIQYTIEITGWAQNANQVKIRIPAGKLTDQYGNTNIQTDLILYNCLELTSSETVGTSKFLDGNGLNEVVPVTGIERQNIQQVIFVNSLSGASGENVKTVWDVSAMSDGSIKAWTEQTAAPYTVYIGSDDEIFANQNSGCLFSYIGYSESCTETETIKNLNLLNVKSVTSMYRMFRYCGNNAMTSLVLPETFDTSNVKTMNSMFENCGTKAMTTLNLGTKFNTGNVTNMENMFNVCGKEKLTRLDLSSGTSETNTTQFNTSKVESMIYMFANCGKDAMISLNLGYNFDTAKVTNMRYMFYNTGYGEMTSLDLGDKFDTSSVTNMYRMFYNCGYTKMTTLNLGTQFNTSRVTDMQKMFDSCGYTAMTSLDLGDLFYTTNVTDMYKMFYNCGHTVMTTLDLGPAFTKIPGGAITKQESDYLSWETDQVLEYNAYDDFATGCGASTLVVYAPESIYLDKTSFKLNKLGQ